jgi:hypothetical protein
MPFVLFSRVVALTSVASFEENAHSINIDQLTTGIILHEFCGESIEERCHTQNPSCPFL